MAKTIQTISECRKLTEKINKQVNEKEYPMSAELGSVVLPKFDKFISHADIFKTDFDDFVDVKFVGIDKETRATMPIYIAKGTLDVTNGEWVSGPSPTDHVYNLRDIDLRTYILDSFNDFKFHDRERKLDALIDRIIEKFGKDKMKDTYNHDELIRVKKSKEAKKESKMMTKRIKKSEELIEPSEVHALAVKELPAEDIDHYYSDLYLRKSPKSTELVNKMKYKDANVTTFRDNIDHDIWYELPFCYSPYWDKKESKKDLFKSIDECVRKANEGT